MIRAFVFSMSLLLVAACLFGTGTGVTPLAPTAASTVMVPTSPVVTLAPPLTPTPGLTLHGYVRLGDGSGLAGITICRNFASYPGVIVGTTDQNGYFQSAFVFIPGDEMVGVWPNSSGYAYEPPYYRWRHYYGSEDRSLDFVASPTTTPNTPLAPCS